MSRPERIYRVADLDGQGRLYPRDLDACQRLIRRGGFILVPSDSAYSIATLPRDDVVREALQALTGRPHEPISVAFDSLAQIDDFAKAPPLAHALLEEYSAGGLTVVYTPLGGRATTQKVIEVGLGVSDGSIGVRLPNSPIERQLAKALGNPITTMPVRRGREEVFRRFAESVDHVTSESARCFPEPWRAIEGTETWFALSSVVRVTEDEDLVSIREGHIPFTAIRAFAARFGRP